MKNIDGLALLETNLSDSSVLNPQDYISHMKKLNQIKTFKIPKYVILCFFKSFYEKVKKEFKPKIIDFISSENPIYVFKYNSVEVAFVFPSMGASYASTVLEELIALGGEYIIFFGGVGTIAPDIKRGEIILPVKAVRDEGTSFHYLKPSRYAYPSKKLTGYIERTLENKKIPFHKGGCWTTDAPYRETRKKVLELRYEGNICVDMEASAFFSVGNFRNVNVSGLFIAGDCVANETWNPRLDRKDIPKRNSDREILLELALETILLIDSKETQSY